MENKEDNDEVILRSPLSTRECICYVVIDCGNDEEKQLLPCLKRFAAQHLGSTRIIMFDTQIEGPSTMFSQVVQVDFHQKQFDYMVHTTMLGILSIELKESGGMLVIADFSGNVLLKDLWIDFGFTIDETTKILCGDKHPDLHKPPWKFDVLWMNGKVVVANSGPHSVIVFDLVYALKNDDTVISQNLEEKILCQLETTKNQSFTNLRQIFNLLNNWGNENMKALPDTCKSKNDLVAKWAQNNQNVKETMDLCGTLLEQIGTPLSVDRAHFTRDRTRDVLKNLLAGMESEKKTQGQVSKIFDSLEKVLQETIDDVKTAIKNMSTKNQDVNNNNNK
jgi:hypothetical protein